MDTLALSVLERRGNRMVVYRMVAPPPHHTVCPTLLSGLRPPWDRDTTLLDDVIGLPVELGESVPASGQTAPTESVLTRFAVAAVSTV
jgi:hypothetical protein